MMKTLTKTSVNSYFVLNLSMLNMVRKERFMLEKERVKVKIGRSDPCLCESGKNIKSVVEPDDE